MTCGKCGGKFVGGSHAGKARKAPVHEYHCISHLKYGKGVCDASSFMQERPDNFVTDKISMDLRNPNFRELVKQKLREKLTSEPADTRSQKDIKKEIDTCKRAIATLLNRIEDDKCDNWQLLNDHLAKRREDLERLNTGLRQHQDAKQYLALVEKVIDDLDRKFLEAADYLSDTTIEDHELNEIKKKIVKQFL